MSQVRVVSSLILLYMLRMMGLFMILPVLALYGDQYAGSSIALLGLALGIYGLSQAALQIPMGILSDFWGRKPVILLGLAIFALGSVVAAYASTIEGLILGRCLQGAGAIAGAVMAMVADLTTEKNRTRAMAAIGASIGISFALALAIGPLIAARGGIDSVFLFTAGSAIAGMLVLYFLVPDVPKQKSVGENKLNQPGSVLAAFKNSQLFRLNWGIFSLHAILMAIFVVVPGILENQLGVSREGHWLVYLLVLLGSFVFMIPIMTRMERRNRVKSVFLGAVIGLALSLAAFAFFLEMHLFVLIWGVLFTFFVAFNLLEASLPSLVSKLAPPGTKGTAMGIYSTSQFSGAFCGGALGGMASQFWGSSPVLFICAGIALIWLLVASGMSVGRVLPENPQGVPLSQE